MTVSIRSTYITNKNILKAEEHIKSGNVKAAGVTPSGEVVIEVQSESTRKISHLLINKEGTLVTHFCERIKKLPAKGSPKEGSCWHMAIALLALHKAYPERKFPELPYALEVVSTFPEDAFISREISQDLIGRPGEFNRCSFVPMNLPVDNEKPVEPEPIVVSDLSEEHAWLGDLGLPPAVLSKVISFREGQLVDLSEEQLARIPKNVNYKAQKQELVQSVSAFAYGTKGQNWEPILLRGPKGTGKSTLVNRIAEIFMLPVNRISGSTDHDLDTLLGGKTLKDGKVVYEEGLLLRAVSKGELLVLDEVNVLRPDITAAIHPLLEHRDRSLAVPGLGYVTPPDPFRTVACMNIGYMGTSIMNEAFKDRFRPINVPYPPVNVVAEIIVAESGCSLPVAGRLSKVFVELKNRAASDDPIEEDVLSMRNLIRSAKETVDNPECELEIATSNLSEGIDDEYTRKVVADVVATIYGERV